MSEAVQDRAGFRAVAAAALLWGGAFSIACWIGGRGPGGVSVDDSLMGRVLGGGRVALGGSFVETADDYFHKGVGHVHVKAFTNSIYQKLGETMRPSGHVHTEGMSVREIMPWLDFALRADPHSVETYLTTAYWLRTALQREDLAEKVLMEGQRENPGDYRIMSDRAIMLMRRGEDERAARLLDTAIRLWPSGLDPEDEGAQLELARILSYRAFLLELGGGERDEVLSLFRRALELSPQNHALAERVAALERGEDLTSRDRDTWDQVFPTRVVCAREGHDHAHEHEHHEHEHESGTAHEHDHGAH